MELRRDIKPAFFTNGRPTSYDGDYCDLLVKHMAGGMSFESFAGVIGVSKKTLWQWTQDHGDFLHAKQCGTEASRLWWEKATVEGLFDQTIHEVVDGKRTTTTKRMNGAVYRQNMSCRFPEEWADRKEITGPGGQPIQHQHQVQVQRVQDALGQLPSDELRHLVDITDKVNQTKDEPVKQLN